jgi:hypothetical protein
VHHEFVTKGQTANQHYYPDTLQCPQENVGSKLPAKWNLVDWFVPHNNALAQYASSVHKFLAKHKITVIPHPRYSPDLMPRDFTYSKNLKMALKLMTLNDITMIQAKSWAALLKCFQW